MRVKCIGRGAGWDKNDPAVGGIYNVVDIGKCACGKPAVELEEYPNEWYHEEYFEYLDDDPVKVLMEVDELVHS